MNTLALLARYWRELAIGLLVLAIGLMVLVDAERLRRCKSHGAAVEQALQQTKDGYRVAQAVAHSDNIATVRRIEQTNATKTAEITNDFQRQLADARARGDAYVQRVRDQAAAARRAAGSTGATGQAATAASTDGAGSAALLANDVRVCTDNTVKAAAWQEWYAALAW